MSEKKLNRINIKIPVFWDMVPHIYI